MPVVPVCELPAIVPLFRALHCFHAEQMPLTYHCGGSDAEYLGVLRSRLDAGGWVFAVECPWGFAGYLLAVPEVNEADFLRHASRRVRLDHLYIAPGFRGRGFGAQLVAEMEERIKDQRFAGWVVGFNAFNREAEEFYARQGTKAHGAFRYKALP